MNTNDIIKSLGMVSPSEMPPRLINEIHAALTERDALRAALRAFLDDARGTAVPGGYEYTISGRMMAAAQSAISKTETGE